MRSLLKRHGAACGSAGAAPLPPRTRSPPGPFDQGEMSYVVTDLVDADYQEYYNGFANRVLWPILHYRLDLAEFSRRDLSGYLRVNEHFAERIAQSAAARRHHLGARLSLHSACQGAARPRHREPDRFLPAYPVSAAGNSHRAAQPRTADPAICHYDLVGFQTENDADNLARYLENECRMPRSDSASRLPDRRADGAHRRLPGRDRDRRSSAGWRGVRCALRSCASVVESLAGRAMIIGVDRLDYSKGIAQRMDAFERFLAAYPRLARQGHLSADHAEEPLGNPGICRHGAHDQRSRRPHQRRLWRGRLDADPLRQPRLQPQSRWRASIAPPGRRWSRRCATG